MTKIATAKELRRKTAALLDEVRRGQEIVITYRGKRIARLGPLERRKRGELDPVGFGMWRGRGDMRSVGRWLKERRGLRHGRSFSTPTS